MGRMSSGSPKIGLFDGVIRRRSPGRAILRQGTGGAKVVCRDHHIAGQDRSRRLTRGLDPGHHLRHLMAEVGHSATLWDSKRREGG